MDEYENTVNGVPDLNPGHMGSIVGNVIQTHHPTILILLETKDGASLPIVGL